jgi:hypothetical protein
MADLWKHAPGWAKIAGYDNVQWSADCASHPTNQWRRLEQQPVVGNPYALAFYSVDVPSDKAPFWVLFLPPSSSENGWDEFPDELALSCVVQCQLVKRLESYAYDYRVTTERGQCYVHWARVTTLGVIGLPHLSERFEPDASAVPMPIRLGRTARKNTGGGFTLFDWNFESDLGVWTVCRSSGTGHALILCGDWGRDYHFFYAGNRPLTHAEFDLMERGFPHDAR